MLVLEDLLMAALEGCIKDRDYVSLKMNVMILEKLAYGMTAYNNIIEKTTGSFIDKIENNSAYKNKIDYFA